MKGETIKPVFIENTMNANELADDLDNANGFQYLAQLGLASQAATMLRQQQAEIEKLKDEVAMWKMSYENNIRFEDGYGFN